MASSFKGSFLRVTEVVSESNALFFCTHKTNRVLLPVAHLVLRCVIVTAAHALLLALHFPKIFYRKSNVCTGMLPFDHKKTVLSESGGSLNDELMAAVQ